MLIREVNPRSKGCLHHITFSKLRTYIIRFCSDEKCFLFILGVG